MPMLGVAYRSPTKRWKPDNYQGELVNEMKNRQKSQVLKEFSIDSSSEKSSFLETLDRILSRA
jgi:hypothetical protein